MGEGWRSVAGEAVGKGTVLVVGVGMVGMVGMREGREDGTVAAARGDGAVGRAPLAARGGDGGQEGGRAHVACVSQV